MEDKINVMHGIFLGVYICALSIHLNVYLGFSQSYIICTTQYMYFGGFAYLFYYLTDKLLKYWSRRKKDE